MCVYVYTYMYIYRCVCIYIYIYIYVCLAARAVSPIKSPLKSPVKNGNILVEAVRPISERHERGCTPNPKIMTRVKSYYVKEVYVEAIGKPVRGKQATVGSASGPTKRLEAGGAWKSEPSEK